MTNFLKTKAIVLRRTNFGESDRIIKFLTEHGQLSALAKGVRKPKSKLAGALEPFSVTDLVLAKGNGDLYRVTSASLQQYFSEIIADYDRLELGYYFIKIANRLSQDVDGSGWFVILKQTLEALNRPALDARLIKTWFNFQAASMLGEEFNVEISADGAEVALDKNYSYDVVQKSLVRDNQGKISGDVLKLLKAFNLYDLPTVARIKNIEQYLDLMLNVSMAHLSLE